MSSFTEPLILEYLPPENLWKTSRNFVYYVGEENSGDRIMVPKGFITDLASVPWPAMMFIPKSGKYNAAAVLHDFLYFMDDIKILRSRGLNNEGGWKNRKIKEKFPILKTFDLDNHHFRTRKECDDIFLESMQVLKVNWFKRNFMYQAVRKFAWLAWGKESQIIRNFKRYAKHGDHRKNFNKKG